MTPILYSFRRCPFAMRARLALLISAQTVELREIALRHKPASLHAASPKATVPVLVLPDRVIEQSLQIMTWALDRHDPAQWRRMPALGHALIAENDGRFKAALDRCKYPDRHSAQDVAAARLTAHDFLTRLDAQLDDWLFTTPSLADFAILPFVRQFAAIDKPAFAAAPWPRLQAWLNAFLTSAIFADCMVRHPIWQDPPHSANTHSANT